MAPLPPPLTLDPPLVNYQLVCERNSKYDSILRFFTEWESTLAWVPPNNWVSSDQPAAYYNFETTILDTVWRTELR